MRNLTLGVILMLNTGMAIAQFSPEDYMRNGLSANYQAYDQFKQNFSPSDFTSRAPPQTSRSIFHQPGTNLPVPQPPPGTFGPRRPVPIVFSQEKLKHLLGHKGYKILKIARTAKDIYDVYQKGIRVGSFNVVPKNALDKYGPAVTYYFSIR